MKTPVNNLNKLIPVLLALLLQCGLLNAQISFKKTENGIAKSFVDPRASLHENGLDFGFMFGYSGAVYAVAQFENFSALQGGYTSIGGGIGFNITTGKFNPWQYYMGLRLGLVFRDSAFRPIAGMEGGIDIPIGKEGFTVGLRATYDWREDMGIIDSGTETMRASGFIVIGKRFNL